MSYKSLVRLKFALLAKSALARLSSMFPYQVSVMLVWYRCRLMHASAQRAVVAVVAYEHPYIIEVIGFLFVGVREGLVLT